MTKDYLHGKTARILLIGHDPRLQESEIKAEYAFFADYYFRPIPTISSEKAKYGLAKSAFDQLNYLMEGEYKPEEIYITNLCNNNLPSSPQGNLEINRLTNYKFFRIEKRRDSIIISIVVLG